MQSSQFSKYPWLNQKYIDEIEERTKNAPSQYKAALQQQMYADMYKQQQLESQQNERSVYKNQIIQKSINSSSKWEQAVMNAELKTANLADIIRDKYKISTSAGSDNDVIGKFVSQINDGDRLLADYVEWKNSDLLSRGGLISPVFAELNEKNKVKTNWTIENTAVYETLNKQQSDKPQLTSTSMFDNDEYASNYISNQADEYKNFIEAAQKWWYSNTEIAAIIEASKKYQQYIQNQEDYKNRSASDKLEEFSTSMADWFMRYWVNLYNNLLGNNPYVWIAPSADSAIDRLDESTRRNLQAEYDPTGYQRAESWWSQFWKWVWQAEASIISNIALMRLLPWMWWEGVTSEAIKEAAAEWGKSAVKQLVLDNTIQGAAQWGLWWFLYSAWEEDPQKNMGRNMVVWSAIGWISWFWQAKMAELQAKNSLMNQLNELQKTPEYKQNQQLKKQVDNTQTNLRDKYEKWVRPSGMGKKWTAEYNKSIDDWIDSVETIVKNKDKLKITNSDWEIIEGKLPESNQEFTQAIQQTKKNIYDQYHQYVKDADKAKISTKNIVSELKKLMDDDVTMAGNKWLKSKIKTWVKDLEKIDGMSPEQAEQKIAELNNKLQTFYKNPQSAEVNDNMLNSLIRNNLKNNLDDAIEANLGQWNSEAYNALRQQYWALRNIEKDVNQRALVIARKNSVSLPDTIANISSAEDFVKAAAGSPEWLLSFTAKQWLRAWIKKMNDPDTYIKSLFTDVDKIVNTTPNVYNLVQEWMLR